MRVIGSPSICELYFRLRLATFAACLPNAVRVRFGSFDIVRFRFAAAAAFLILRRAAARCLADAINTPLI
jgi:hypothetical protein